MAIYSLHLPINQIAIIGELMRKKHFIRNYRRLINKSCWNWLFSMRPE